MGKITTSIDQFGRPTTKASGFVGGECKNHIAHFTKGYGGESVIEDNAEMHQIELTSTEEEMEER